MSRINLDAKEPYDVVVGLDHALGYFLQVWDDTKDPDENLIVDKDQILCRGFGRGPLLEEVQQYILDTPRNKRALDLIALDLDPGS